MPLLLRNLLLLLHQPLLEEVVLHLEALLLLLRHRAVPLRPLLQHQVVPLLPLLRQDLDQDQDLAQDLDQVLDLDLVLDLVLDPGSVPDLRITGSTKIEILFGIS